MAALTMRPSFPMWQAGARPDEPSAARCSTSAVGLLWGDRMIRVSILLRDFLRGPSPPPRPSLAPGCQMQGAGDQPSSSTLPRAWQINQPWAVECGDIQCKPINKPTSTDPTRSLDAVSTGARENGNNQGQGRRYPGCRSGDESKDPVIQKRQRAERACSDSKLAARTYLSRSSFSASSRRA